MHKRLCTQLTHTFAAECNITAMRVPGHSALYNHYREIEQGIIVHLIANPLLLAYRIFVTAAQYHLITNVQPLLRLHIIDYALSLAHTLHEQPLALPLKEMLQFLNLAPILEPLVTYAVTAELHLALRRGKARLLTLVAAHTHLKLTAFRLHLVDAAKQPRPQPCQYPRRARSAEYVSHRVCHRDNVQHPLLLIGRQPKPAYRVTGNANYCTDSL